MAGENVSGLKSIQAALRKQIQKDGTRVRAGLLRTGHTLQRLSQLIVPVEYALLKNSARTSAEGQGVDAVVTVSYGTEYAVFVHEDLEAQHADGKSAKYLEIPLRTNRTELKEAFHAGVKGVQ